VKILIVTPYFYPSVGGAQNYALQLTKGLARDYGHEVVVVTSGEKNGDIKKEKIEGITVYRLPYKFMVSNTPISFLWKSQIKKIIAKEKPDIVNAHSPVPYIADVTASVSKDSHIPFVLTYHSGSMKKYKLLPDILIRIYESVFLPKLLKKVVVVVTYNKFLPERYSCGGKTAYVFPGVNTKIFQPLKSKNRAGTSSSNILFVGRIDKTSEWKGINVLLKAMPYVLVSEPSAILRIVGAGDAVENYKKLAIKLGVENNVKFIGEKFGEKLANEYRDASVLVLPSVTESESFGIVLIEALACGTPVVASNIGGMPQVIHSTGGGLLVEAGNEEKLAEAICAITTDKTLRNKLAEAGLHNVKRLYTWESTVQNFNKVITQIKPYNQIVHVVPTYPPQLGGMEKVVQTLATVQASQSKNVSVITSDQGLKQTTKLLDKVKVKRLWSFEIAHTPIMPKLFWELIRLKRDDIVHLHVAQPYTPEVVLLASKLKRFRYIAHVHLDVGPSGPAGFLLKIYKPLILKHVLRTASYVVVFTKDQKIEIHKKYNLDVAKIEVIPNGVEDKFYYDKARVIHKPPRVLFVGRLNVQKNLTQFFQALDGISNQFEVSIVGDGDQYQELKKLMSTLKLQNVTFHGRADGRKLLNFYKRANIFVLPSEREGMPLVLLEAMAMGLPLIATDVTGNRDVIKEDKNGLLVPFGDFKALREALLRIVSSKVKYSRMSNYSRQMATHYSWNKVEKQLESLYYEVSR
jgi:glycosyltransferase involved in cell wall biosynthesis